MAAEIIAQDKRCTKCGTAYPIDQFPPRRGRPSGRQSHCRSCRGDWLRSSTGRKCSKTSYALHKDERIDWQRKYWLRSKYGLTLEDYERMVVEQGGVCRLCKKRGRSSGQRLVVDHCHETNRVRGLLCTRCNSALGVLGDTPESIRRALEYVQISTGSKRT